MRGWAKFYEPRSRMQTAQAKEIFDRALRLDPSNVDAMIGKASCLVVEVISGWSTSVSEDQKAAADFADKALSKRPASAPAHVIKGDVLRYGHPEDAVREYDAALEIDPNFPVAYANRALSLILSGRAREAFSPIRVGACASVPRTPLPSSGASSSAMRTFTSTSMGKSVEECRRSTYLSNSFWPPYVDLVSAFGATGQLEQAQSALAVLYEIRPDFTVQRYREFGYALSSNPQYRREIADLLDGLRRREAVREQ